MARTFPEAGYRIYWFTWVLLLLFTLAMLVTGYLPLSKAIIVLLLILAMLLKASLIGAHFMHLRFEKLSLVLAVVGGILVTGAILFFLISFDGIRILELSAP
ncbi:MAG: cytochrome C oxidase subunit IV family protein [Terriglobia bacterium]